MKKLLLLIFVLSFSATLAQTLLLNENFSYSPGQLTDAGGGANVGGGNWITNSGTSNYIQISSGSLSYSGYPSSGVNNKLEIISTTSSAEDTYRSFTTQTSGNVYAAFLLNVTNSTGLTASGDYFVAFIPSANSTSYAGRVYIQTGATSNQFRMGLRYNSADASVTYSATDLNVGTTYLIVLKYQVIAGTPNDVVSLFINPSLTGNEPVANLTATCVGTTSTTGDNADVAKIGIRQGTGGTPNASIDGIRISNNWGLAVTGTATSVEQNNSTIPTTFDLYQNYPNPFNPSTVIKYQIPQNTFVNINIYDVLGNQIKTLVREEKAAGNYELKFDASNMPSGVYFYSIQAGAFSQTKKMILMK